MTVTVYTTNLGRFDNLRPPLEGCRNARFLCYADEPIDAPEPWEVLPAHRPFPGDPARNVRVHKMLSHLFTETEYSIWMDANFVLAIEPEIAVARWLRDTDIAVFKHPGRSCLYDEAACCLGEGIGSAADIEAQIEYYRACGFPAGWGLFACGVILRRHTPRVARLNEAWWADVRDFSARDQIAFPFALRQQDVPVTVINENIFDNSSFLWKWHGWKTDHRDNIGFAAARERAEARKRRIRELSLPDGRPPGEDLDRSAGFSVVILSRNADNLVPCVRAVLANEPGLGSERIIVVDDGAREAAEPRLPGVRFIDGEEPFVFARNANLGIDAADGDVILLNDDALLMSPGGFTTMWRTARASPEYGLVSATTNVAANPAQEPRGVGLRKDENVAFVCVLIPRATRERVGPLDERYRLDYGVEDRDYCHRVVQAGLKVGIHDGCFVDHAYLTSTYRGDPRASREFSANLGLFKEKWGLA